MITYTLLLFSVIFAAGTVRAWDLAVETQSQLQFLKQNTVVNTAADQLKSKLSIAYDPIKKDLYISDTEQDTGSIFRIRTTGDAAYVAVEPVVAKQSGNSGVQGMAFDHHTNTLYWTTGNGRTINYVRVPENRTKVPLIGQVLLRFETEVPRGIAIDTCRGYLYWTNTNHLNATIERSRLNGSDRQVLVKDGLFHPHGVAVDMEQNLLYWCNEQGLYYGIEYSQLDGSNRTAMIRGMHHEPNAIALDDQNVYWSDSLNYAVWSLPRNASGGGVKPKKVVSYGPLNLPMGLITPTGNATYVNETYCAMNRAKDIAETATTPPEMIPYDVLRNICKNSGVLHANGTCTCAPGFEGEYCQTGVCDGYCVTGTCTIQNTGQPTCHCSETSYGDRCEKQVCDVRCQNGGQCVLDSKGNPRCECQVGYVGDACDFKRSWVDELCPEFCQLHIKSEKFSFCRCDEYNKTMMNDSDISSCKLSKIMMGVLALLAMFVASLGTIVLMLARKVRLLGRRPRIKKRIVVNRSITPLTCRPADQQQQNQQCEITIENCCNMNICETPCFEPDFRPSKMGGLMPTSLGKSKKEDKINLLSNTDMSSEDEKPPY